MKQGWKIKKLGEIARIINGYAFDSKLFSTDENDMPLIRIRDIKKGYTETFYKGKYSDNYIVKNGDYIIGMDGEFNITEWGGGDALLNQRVCKIEIVDDSVIGRYVLRFLSIELKHIEDATSFVTVKHLSSKSLLSIPIPVPERAEQERIVGELDCLSGIIAAKRAQLRELDTLAQSIFYTMFGDPITNDKGWQTKKLPEFCTVISTGITYKPENVTDDGIIVLRSSNIQNNQFVLDDIVRINMSLKESQYVQQNDILMCSRNGSARLVGKVALIPNTTERMSWGAFMTIIRSEFYHFLFQYFQLPAFRQQLIKTKTSTVNQITIGMLKDIFVPVPPIDLQKQFAEKIENIERQKELITKSIKETEDLFNSRMDYYFN